MAWPGTIRRRADEARAAIEAFTPLKPRVHSQPLNLIPPTREEFLAMRALWALTVPAYKRGHSLICSTVAQLPLRQQGNGLAVPATMTTSGETPWVTKNRVTSDLLNWGYAFLKITGSVYGPRFTRLDAADVTLSDDGRTVRTSLGKELTVSDPLTAPVLGQVVVIVGEREGCITAGSDVLTTGIALQLATRHYAEEPHPGDVLKNVSGFELSDTEIQEQLTLWRDSRAAGSTAYMNAGFELADARGWSPTELALDAQKNQNVLDVARLQNLDATWLNAVVGGTSLTYSNRVDLRQDLADLTCSAFTLPIAQRLSMPDCYGGEVRFLTSAFLRGNIKERAELAVQMVGIQAWTPDQAAQYVADTPGGEPV